MFGPAEPPDCGGEVLEALYSMAECCFQGSQSAEPKKSLNPGDLSWKIRLSQLGVPASTEFIF